MLAIYILSASCSTYVPPNMVGIRQVYYGSEAGIRPESYGPGLHIIVGGDGAPAPVPARSPGHQLQRFVRARPRSVSGAAPSIKIQTSDGYNVQLDVTVLYRIEDAHKVFVEAGPGQRSRTGW